MSKELVIGSNRHETKVAVLEEDQLVEVFFQRGNEYSLAGSIHKGRVTRVLPGMQSAFVDLGLERDTFLYVSDFFEENEDIDTVGDEKPARNEGRRGEERPNRGDRRDRGPGRGNGRPQGQQATDSREQPQAITPPASPEEIPELADIEDATVVASPDAPESRDATAEARQPEQRGEGDRASRGFDRRGGRRSRRRPRGRGIPENKYAQPAGAVSPQESSAELEEGDESEAPNDVIILPGESLAKYRHSAPPAAASRDESLREDESALASEAEKDPEETPAANVIPQVEPQPEEDIEAQAEEIEFTDKVFGHNGANDVVPEGEKLETPREDAAAPPPAFVVSDIDPGEEEHLLLPGHAEALHIEPFHETMRVPHPALQPETSIDEKILPIAEKASPIEDDIAAAEEAPAGPDVEGTEEEPGQLETGEESAPAAAQTAEVRDQGGRSMHRMSRRMRRRRGGNRFGREAQGGNGNAEAAGITTAAATAVALDSTASMETRADQARFEAPEERSAAKPERVLPSITDLLKPGQEIIVQIAKEPLGQKGARITSHIALPGRYVVFMPSVNHLGVSRKIASDEERQRLKRVLQAHRVGTTGGFIVRTAGEGIPEEEIAADMNFLYSLWLDIRQKAEKKPAPALLHYDLDVVQRILRDQVTEDFKAIWVDNEEMYESVLSFMQRFQPALVNRVKMYTRTAPIFDAFNITQELEKALRPKVWLKSGGYIVINQTEALVAIDINTGKYVGKTGRLEDTIVKTNTEAVKEIVRQIRLRDLGGIIVVDFIDMDERKNRQKVMQALEEAMEADKAPYKILQFNDFGLVAITRKRVKQSLERTLCSPCPYCEGAGYVKSVQTIVGEILVEAQKIAKAIDGKDVMLRVHPDVAKVLKASDNKYLEELEEVLGKPVLVKGDPTLHHEKFDLA
jgi:ribonuclease G